MHEIFINCQECGRPNALKGADPAMLGLIKGWSNTEHCSTTNCPGVLSHRNAYVGMWSDDQTEVIALEE